jgi:hypothetical protein
MDTPNLTAVTSASSIRTHLLRGESSTVCGVPVNAERWTVRAHRHVHDTEWCGRCWNRALA